MSSTIEQATLTAPDISCGHCVTTINQAVGALDGVRRVETSEQPKQVQVEYDPRRLSPAQIEAVMDEESYPGRR